jgi:flagellar biosynthesis protein FlhF
MSNMQLRTFRASTMAECLGQVKTALGHEAVILHTRQFHRRVWLGLRRIEVVEITAGTGMNVAPRRAPMKQSHAAAGVTAAAGAASRAAYAARSNGAVVVSEAPPGADLLKSQAAGNIAMLALNREMEAVKTAIRDLTTQVKSNMSLLSAGTPPADVPEELFEFYRTLIENEVAETYAQDVIRTLKSTLRPEHLKNAEFVRDKIVEFIEKMIPVAGPIQRTKASGPHTVALIGPTGVGKTTTIAKLAAHFKLRERCKVGLITIDTYRLAAVDQLKRYALILGLPLKVVNGMEETRDAIEAMRDFDYILIDTAGRSPKDSLKLGELREYLAVAAVDEVHLVLSSTMSEKCVDVAVERFGEVKFDKLIFTKLDEASHIGMVINAIRRLDKALSYITTGQDVPADIEVGRGKRLAQMILEERSAS